MLLLDPLYVVASLEIDRKPYFQSVLAYKDQLKSS